MYRRILLTTDGTLVAAAAIPYAGALARILGAEVVVLRVSPVAGDAPDSVTADTWDQAISAGAGSPGTADEESSLDEIVAQLQALGAGSTGRLVVRGDPGTAIVSVAERLPVDLLVMASHGHSGWKRAVLGSVADHVSRSVGELPVLLCRPLPVDCESPFDGLAVALDGSPLANAALRHVEAIRSAAGSTTQVIRIIEHEGTVLSTAVPVAAADPLPHPLDTTTSARGRRGLEVEVEDLVANGLRLERAEGGIAASIISTARSTGCATIVMSTRGRGGIARTLLGSVGDEVARNLEAGAVLLARGTPSAAD